MTETETAAINPSPESGLAHSDPTSHESIVSSETGYSGARVAPERKATIYTLVDVLGLAPSAVAERLSMDFRTVKAVLEHRSSDAIAARNLLDVNSLDAAKAWVLACQTGAAKGRHEPARDLLLHRGVIEPVKQDAPSNTVTVVLNGGSAPPELRSIDVSQPK